MKSCNFQNMQVVVAILDAMEALVVVMSVEMDLARVVREDLKRRVGCKQEEAEEALGRMVYWE